MLSDVGARPLWAGSDGREGALQLLLGDGSSFTVTTGSNAWTGTDAGRPLQSWVAGHVHLDDGPLTTAGSRFLADLRTALTGRLAPGEGPLSLWLSQQVGLPLPSAVGAAAAELSWDVARGWVPASSAGTMARVLAQGLVPAGQTGQTAGAVVERAARFPGALAADRLAEERARVESGARDGAVSPGTAAERAAGRSVLHEAALRLAQTSLTPALSAFLGSPVQVLAEVGGHVVVRVAGGELVVVAVLPAESSALPGSRAQLAQAGTQEALAQLADQLAADPAQARVGSELTAAREAGRVRSMLAQPVVTSTGFVGTRLTEFAPSQGAGGVVGSPGGNTELTAVPGELATAGTSSAVPDSRFRGDARRIAHPRTVTRLADRALRAVSGLPGVGETVQLGRGTWRVELDGRDVEVRVRSGPTGTDVARFTLDADAGRLEVTVSERALSRHVPRALAHELADAAAVLRGAADTDLLTASDLPAGAPDVLSAHDRGRLAELSVLVRQALSDNAWTRARATADAGALLRSLGLVEGVNDPATGRTEGGSPDFPRRLAALPPAARAEVLTLNELPGLGALPEAVAGRWATAVEVVVGGGAAAVLAQASSLALGLVTGDAARIVPAVVAGTAGVGGAVSAGLAERAHARLRARRTAHDENQRGPAPELRGARDARVGQLAEALDARRAELAGTRTAVAALRAELGTPPAASASAAPAAARRAALDRPGSSPDGPGSAVSRTADGLPRPDGAARVPGTAAWVVRHTTGPLTAAGIGLVGLGVAGLLGLSVGPALLPTLVSAVGGSLALSVAQRGLARHRATLEDARTVVEETRATALARARTEHALAAETRALERARTARAALTGDGPAVPTASADPAGDQLVPGAAQGVVDPARFTDADLARLAEVRALAEQLAGAPRDRRAALPEQLRAAAREAGLDAPVDPTSPDTDPDRLGWPRRRAALDPELLAPLQALDRTPSAVPGLGAHSLAGAVGTVVPGVLGGVAVASVVGFGPLALVTIAVAPAVAAAASAVGQWRGARGVEVRKAARSAARTASSPALDAQVERVRARLRAERADVEAGTAALAAEQQRLAELRRQRAVRARTQRRLAGGPGWDRVRDAVFRQADPEPPAIPPAPTPRAGEPAPSAADPAPVPVGGPVASTWREALGSYVTGPVLTAAAAVGGWHVLVDQRVTDLLSPSVWTTWAAGDPRIPAAVAVGSATLGALASVGAAVTERQAARSAATAEERRAAAAAVRTARLVGPLAVADTAALTRAADEVAAQLAAGRVELAELQAAVEARADRLVPLRGPGLVPAALSRAAAWVAALTRADAAALLHAADPGTPVHRAALERAAGELAATAPGDRAAALAAVAAEVQRADLVPGPAPATPAGPPTALGATVAAVAAVPTGWLLLDDDAFWQLVHTIANATGWWPEEHCEAAPGRPCTCPHPPAPGVPVPPAATDADADPVPAPDLDAAADPEAVPGTRPDGASGPAPAAPSTGTPTAAEPGAAAGALPSATAPQAAPPRTPAPAVPAPLVPPLGPPPRRTPTTAPATGSGRETRAAGRDGGAARGGLPPLPYRPPAGDASRVAAAGTVDVDLWPAGAGSTRSTVVPVTSPSGEQVQVLVRWVDPGPGRRPVLVLSDVPGPGLWWGVPAAVLAAVTAALAVLSLPRGRAAEVVVLGHRPDAGPGPGVLTELPVGVPGGVPSVLTGRAPRVLDPQEAEQAARALRLRSVPDLLGRLSARIRSGSAR